MPWCSEAAIIVGRDQKKLLTAEIAESAQNAEKCQVFSASFEDFSLRSLRLKAFSALPRTKPSAFRLAQAPAAARSAPRPARCHTSAAGAPSTAKSSSHNSGA